VAVAISFTLRTSNKTQIGELDGLS
jgi:hypothetical protein